jgi:hypothetical protein
MNLSSNAISCFTNLIIEFLEILFGIQNAGILPFLIRFNEKLQIYICSSFVNCS